MKILFSYDKYNHNYSYFVNLIEYDYYEHLAFLTNVTKYEYDYPISGTNYSD